MPRIASSAYVPQLIAVSATCGLLATVAWVTQGTQAIPAAVIPVPQIESIAIEPVYVSEVAAVRQPAPPPVPSSQLLFVFEVGGETYVKLSDDEPKHGKRKMSSGDDSSTVAEVEVANLPAKFRGYADKTFIVDGGCTATVKGFAVVTRMEGSPGYAGLDDEKWTTSTAAAAGTSQLAARLDVPEACDKPLFARDASLAPMVTLEKLDRPDLIEQARSALLASAAADEAQAGFAEAEQSGPWIDRAQVTSFTRRHPTTGAIYVAMHASIQEGCGGPSANVWGLFRVGRNGKLVTLDVRKLDSIYEVERILDVDNDGKLEMLGRDWLGLSVVLAHADGEEISRLPMQFHGCGC